LHLLKPSASQAAAQAAAQSQHHSHSHHHKRKSSALQQQLAAAAAAASSMHNKRYSTNTHINGIAAATHSSMATHHQSSEQHRLQQQQQQQQQQQPQLTPQQIAAQQHSTSLQIIQSLQLLTPQTSQHPSWLSHNEMLSLLSAYRRLLQQTVVLVLRCVRESSELDDERARRLENDVKQDALNRRRARLDVSDSDDLASDDQTSDHDVDDEVEHRQQQQQQQQQQQTTSNQESQSHSKSIDSAAQRDLLLNQGIAPGQYLHLTQSRPSILTRSDMVWFSGRLLALAFFRLPMLSGGIIDAMSAKLPQQYTTSSINHVHVQVIRQVN
jgi:hypothetical protein